MVADGKVGHTVSARQFAPNLPPVTPHLPALRIIAYRKTGSGHERIQIIVNVKSVK